MTTTSTTQKQIIVCDDCDDILGMLSTVLRDAGFSVTTTHGFSELIDALKNRKPDLFLLDVFMPECDGFWIAEELKYRGYETPVIFMTAFDNPSARLNAPVSGAVEYFIKPFDPKILVEKVRKALGVKSSESNWHLKVTESPDE